MGDVKAEFIHKRLWGEPEVKVGKRSSACLQNNPLKKTSLVSGTNVMPFEGPSSVTSRANVVCRRTIVMPSEGLTSVTSTKYRETSTRTFRRQMAYKLNLNHSLRYIFALFYE